MSELDDQDFPTTCGEIANDVYQRALQGGKATEQKTMELSWTAVGFEQLDKNVRGFQSDLKDLLQKSGAGSTGVNLFLIKSSVLKYLKDLYLKKRIYHLLVFMIAEELKNCKLYPIPVRFTPYKSLADAKLSELEI